MVKTITQITIARPLAEVWKFVTDVEKSALWQTGITNVSATNGAEVGSEVTVTSHNFGREFTTTVLVTDNDGESYIRAESTSGPIRLTTAYKLEEIDKTSTRLTQEAEAKASVFFQLAQPVLQYMAEVKQESDLKLLKTVLESQVHETAS